MNVSNIQLCKLGTKNQPSILPEKVSTKHTPKESTRTEIVKQSAPLSLMQLTLESVLLTSTDPENKHFG